MYQQGHRIRRRRKVYGWLIGSLVLLAAVGAVAFRLFIKSDTSITQSPPHTAKITYGETAKPKQFNQGIFILSLPADWQPIPVRGDQVPKPTYSWQNTAKSPGVRRLDVYVDIPMKDTAVNRIVAVQGYGDHMNVDGSPSDNCTTFTPAQSDQAKWQGVQFLCDIHNFSRDVVGTSSPQVPNSVTLTGKTAGAHTFFFAYTDNDGQPDYSIFIAALRSFLVQ